MDSLSSVKGELLDQHSGHVSNLTSASEGLGRTLDKPQIPDFAFSLELRHSRDSLFDGHGFIEAVAVVEVDVKSAQAGQASFAGCASRRRRM